MGGGGGGERSDPAGCMRGAALGPVITFAVTPPGCWGVQCFLFAGSLAKLSSY